MRSSTESSPSRRPRWTITTRASCASTSTPDGFHLNGRRVQLYGVCLHHDHGPLGMTLEQAIRTLNHIRTRCLHWLDPANHHPTTV